MNHFDKYKGARRGPNLNKEEIRDLPDNHSKRMDLRLVNTVYDPIGLIVSFIIKLKLEMRKLYLDENKLLDWDESILLHLRDNRIELLSEMFDIQEIKFKRCIKSENCNPDEKPNLVTFSDGSMKAFCVCTYIQWKLLNGEYCSHLISAKARIGPTNKISIPRMEVQGAVMNYRLHNAVKNDEDPIVDSGAVMDMITKESISCKEFVGTLIGEV